MSIFKNVIGPPLCVAEISASHNGKLSTAKQLIDRAQQVGADAAKIQCYDPDSLTLDIDSEHFRIKDGTWKGRRLYDLYRQAHTPMEWMEELFGHAKSNGFPLFASVFCSRGLQKLEEVGCPAYKIASMEITDIPLIKAVGFTYKPMIISTGMANNKEIFEALEALPKSTRPPPVYLLHCVSGYPTPAPESNLRRMVTLDRVFCRAHKSRMIGLSDHTPDITIPIAATALGARLIEKHIKLDDKGPDASFSLFPSEFAEMVSAVQGTWFACNRDVSPSEDPSLQFRRSLHVSQDIARGQELTIDNIRSVRPSGGLPPGEWPIILGQVATRDLQRGEPLAEDMFSECLESPDDAI